MKKISDIIYRLEILIASSAFAIMVIVTIANVLARFTIKKSFGWAEEIAYMMMNWSVYMGVCIVYKNQGLIAIDALVDRFPKKVQRILQIFTFGLVGCTNLALVVWGYQYAIASIDRITPMLRWSYIYINISIPICCAILAAYSFGYMIDTIKGEEVKEASLEERS
ncbi:MAG: hypothetical protein BEN19_06255 [Epulopiscium sp. Nuni2H_MBin003]|nr:MAG: hypothetical protein BEN19_06255 [Epulopiscium sp. Nuni2H_MBin003]